MSKTLRCPFLKTATKEYISEIGGDVLTRLAHLCPHMRRMSTLDTTVPKKFTSHSQLEDKGACLDNESKLTKNIFDYDGFFGEKLNEKHQSHTYRIFKRISRSADSFPIAKSYETNVPIGELNPVLCNNVVVWCSNDYLGLSRHPAVIKNAKNTIDNYGVGSGGTRNISGNHILHELLENKLAEWYNKEAGLLFSSCYVANTTTLYTLAKIIPNCVIISDQGNHASMIEGIRNSRVEKYIYRHNDVDHLESILRQLDRKRPKIVAFESLNSMNGSIAPIKDICSVAHEYGAITFIDEVHAIGLYGHNGSGQGELQGILGSMDIISGTMGKTIGSMGGFIVGKKSLVDFVRSYGSGLIFTTSLPPILASTAITSISILTSDEGRELRNRHQKIADLVRRSLTKNGFPIFYSLSHILPVHVGNAKICRKISDYLLSRHNMYVQSINYPTVKQGTERLRLAPTPYHTETDIESMIYSLVDVWKKFNLPFLHDKCHNTNCSCTCWCSSLNTQALPITNV